MAVFGNKRSQNITFGGEKSFENGSFLGKMPSKCHFWGKNPLKMLLFGGKSSENSAFWREVLSNHPFLGQNL